MLKAALEGLGYSVIDSASFNRDGAPRMSTGEVLPDMDISLDGQRGWVEMKWKSGPTWTRVTQQMEHGIPWHHWDAYWGVQERTGGKVSIAIEESSNAVVLVASLEELQRAGVRRTRMRKGGRDQELMCYFPQSAMKPLFRVVGEQYVELDGWDEIAKGDDGPSQLELF